MKITIDAKNKTWSFPGTAQESCLQSGLAAGINMPYECATGTCGSCQARLVEGEVEDCWPEAPAREKLGENVRLLCQCNPKTDCTFETNNIVYDYDNFTVTPKRTTGKITHFELLTADVAEIKVSVDKVIHYHSGQFVTLECKEVPGARAYSMTNFDAAAEELSFVIKRKPGGGWSNWLFEYGAGVVGKKLRVHGAFGKAVFTPDIGKNLLIIAGGSGIAGMMAILSRAAETGYFKQYRGDVFFGVRRPEDGFFLKTFQELAARNEGKLSITVAFSDAEATEYVRKRYPELQFETGFIHEVAAEKMDGRYKNVRAYLAGPPPAVEAAQRILIIQGKLAPADIRLDKFN